MGTCIICGASADGHICQTHEEDVLFEFRGSSPDELTTGRYYKGTVDGFADFGVFVNLASSVTGLLHRSEVPGRLESLDWDAGDTVFVQVDEVHENGNVDLSWSIRQREREFRGLLIDDPDAPTNAELPEEEAKETETAEPVPEPEVEVEEEAEVETEAEEAVEAVEAVEAEAEEAEAEAETEAAVEAEAEEEETPERVAIGDLDDFLGDLVEIRGRITSARQTSGPTVFELTDETGAVDCAAFVEAGVRAYPEVGEDDVVRLVGEVERRRGDLQVETEELEVLEGEDREEVLAALTEALNERAAPTDDSLLVADEDVEPVHDDLVTAATTIRRAVIEDRPVVIRHTADVDGYVAGTAVEHAVLPLVREEHAASDAEYHFVDRRPLDQDFYDISAATDDVTNMLEAADRHDEKHPLFVLVGTGSTAESVEGLQFLDLYDAPAVVVDGGWADDEAVDAADVLVSPTVYGEQSAATGTIGAHLGALVDADARDDLAHLPGICFWDEVPETYADAAADAGYDDEDLAEMRDAVALEAFYNAYQGKRELIADLLWGDEDDLREHVAGQFRTRLDREVDTADPHLDTHDFGSVTVTVLDVDAFTHRYDFPPVDLLLDALHRRRSEGDVTLGWDSDELRFRSDETLDVRAVAESVADDAPDAGVTAKGGRDGHVEFLRGERDDVLDAALDAVAESLD